MTTRYHTFDNTCPTCLLKVYIDVRGDTGLDASGATCGGTGLTVTDSVLGPNSTYLFLRDILPEWTDIAAKHFLNIQIVLSPSTDPPKVPIDNSPTPNYPPLTIDAQSTPISFLMSQDPNPPNVSYFKFVTGHGACAIPTTWSQAISYVDFEAGKGYLYEEGSSALQVMLQRGAASHELGHVLGLADRYFQAVYWLSNYRLKLTCQEVRSRIVRNPVGPFNNGNFVGAIPPLPTIPPTFNPDGYWDDMPYYAQRATLPMAMPGDRVHLFDIGLNFKTELEAEPKPKPPSTSLRNVFQTNGQSLSSGAITNDDDVGVGWAIYDNNMKYLVLEQGQVLSVYDAYYPDRNLMSSGHGVLTKSQLDVIIAMGDLSKQASNVDNFREKPPPIWVAILGEWTRNEVNGQNIDTPTTQMKRFAKHPAWEVVPKIMGGKGDAGIVFGDKSPETAQEEYRYACLSKKSKGRDVSGCVVDAMILAEVMGRKRTKRGKNYENDNCGSDVPVPWPYNVFRRMCYARQLIDDLLSMW